MSRNPRPTQKRLLTLEDTKPTLDQRQNNSHRDPMPDTYYNKGRTTHLLALPTMGGQEKGLSTERRDDRYNSQQFRTQIRYEFGSNKKQEREDTTEYESIDRGNIFPPKVNSRTGGQWPPGRQNEYPGSDPNYNAPGRTHRSHYLPSTQYAMHGNTQRVAGSATIRDTSNVHSSNQPINRGTHVTDI